MGNGTALVVAATRTLGAAHTFAGQYRERPELVTRGVYGLTPNPLYLGVFQCELGALLCAARHVPALFPDGYSYWVRYRRSRARLRRAPRHVRRRQRKDARPSGPE
jgi:protein-S-isoprenylcysteine O-methyltransferase Ste14